MMFDEDLTSFMRNAAETPEGCLGPLITHEEMDRLFEVKEVVDPTYPGR